MSKTNKETHLHGWHRTGKATKRVVIIAALLCLMAGPSEIDRANAQVLILSEEEYTKSKHANRQIGLVPERGEGSAPVGEGWLLLAALGAAYLRRKKKDGGRKNTTATFTKE